MRFTDYTSEELAALTPEIRAVFVPLGCTEQQGPHMTVDFDTSMITRLCEAISDRLAQSHSIKALIMPTLPFGPTPEHAGFGHGYINLRQSTHEAVVEDVLDSLAEQGFHTLLIWRGCGQHELAGPVERFNARHAGARAYQPLPDYGRISSTVLGEVPGGHADSFATSICLFLKQSSLRPDRLRKPQNKPFNWNEPINFAAISDTGVVGDPTQASVEAGEQLWNLCVEAGVEIVLDVLAGRAVHEAWHFMQP